MKIAVNAGHHPELDSGCLGVYSRECDLTKKIAEVVCQDMRNIGYEALFIQENELDDICLLSNNFEADLFVSIHCDAVESKAPNGTTTFVCRGCSNTSRKLAYAIQNQIVNSMGTYDRGVREASYYVTRYTDCPAVLVEVGFLSNPSEEDLINQKYEEFAHAISRGITDSLQ